MHASAAVIPPLQYSPARRHAPPQEMVLPCVLADPCGRRSIRKRRRVRVRRCSTFREEVPFCGGFVMKNSSGGTGLAREERLQIMLSPAELNAVDNYRFQHRMPSRAAAVRELLRHGIGAAGVVMENTGVRSGDYGVLRAPKGVGPARRAQ